MAYTYYIDAYNVIHYCPKLQALARHDFETARDSLIETAARFCAATGHRVRVIFDGRGRQSETEAPFRGAPGLEIVYSPGHQSADTVIEREVFSATNRRELVIVSGDRGIRDLCRALGALVMAPTNFLAEVEAASKELKTTTKHLYQTPGDLSRVEDHLDESALRRLRKLRKKLEE
ncbi:MAG TPA: hypothetical protein HPP83_00965 [Candidatus Hydrogenedentes bacterium]|nr:hypothetical protein [Candidatus Hydrogenedentota bacterium]